ncbi:hypothetical protein Csa_013473 [Cucumis sativus]|uniref:Pentatricopeptide repeat-containing protein n=1 Tax=Cucumis sativus TaxID=3659 RepID=A0A0A0LRK7_CUCSA|nr:hypothetical protein Csa_013473 [Cucumis sativus]
MTGLRLSLTYISCLLYLKEVGVFIFCFTQFNEHYIGVFRGLLSCTSLRFVLLADIRVFHELGFWHSMIFSLLFLRGSSVFRRGFHTGKKLLSPSTEDIICKAICVNLKQRRWKFLEQLSPSLTNSLVCRVIREFRNSPQLALEFYNWVEARDNFSHSLESRCTLVHVLVNSRNFNDALSIMESLILKMVSLHWRFWED